MIPQLQQLIQNLLRTMNYNLLVNVQRVFLDKERMDVLCWYEIKLLNNYMR